MALADQFTRALERANLPIHGVSIGRVDDRTSWVIHYRDEATAAHRTAGDSLRGTFDPANDTDGASEAADRVLDNDKALRAVVIWVAQRLSIPLATARNQVLTIYRGL